MSLENLPGSNITDLIGTDPIKELGAQVIPHEFDLPIPTDPGLAFPKVDLPQINLPQPKIDLPSLDLSSITGPISGKEGAVDKLKETTKTEGVKEDHTDPKVVTEKSSQKTSVSTSTQPQHISKEIAKVAPSVSEDIMAKFDMSMLVAAAANIGVIVGLVSSLAEKAQSLKDMASGVLSAGMALLAGNVQNADNGKDFKDNMLGSGLADAANQAMAMLPLRQIAPGTRNPFNPSQDSKLATSTTVRAEWPNNGTTPDPQETIDNKVKITQDLFQSVGAQEVIKSSCDDLATGAKLADQGLGLPALGMQVDAMTKLGTIQQLNADGDKLTNHSWRYEADTKRKNAANPPTLTNKPKDVRRALKTTSQNISGALPGNLMYAAYGDGEVPKEGALGKVPASIAANMGSPFTSEISNYVNNPDPDLDGMSDSLVSMYLASNPAAVKLYKSMLAFQKVAKKLIGLTPQQLTELKNNETKLGGDFIYFVQKVRSEEAKLQPVNSLANNFVMNKMSYEQHDLILELANYWENLSINPDNFTVVNTYSAQRYGDGTPISESVLDIVSSVSDAKQDLDPNESLSSLVGSAGDILNNMGGPVGPEVAYAAANQAIMTRMSTVVNASNLNTDGASVTGRIMDMAAVGANNAKSMTFPGAQGDWFDAVSSSTDKSPEGLFNVGIPSCIDAVQNAIDQQQTTMATLGEMKAQNRGDTTVGAGEAANDINHLKENTDTQNFISGALNHQYETIKTVLLKSITTISGTAKLMSDTGIVDNLKNVQTQALGASNDPDYFTFTENLVKEITNALASTTLAKVTGIKFDQQTEGRVQQAKFILNQSGSSLANEAPVIRSTARLNVIQAEKLVQETHSLDTKTAWEHHLVDKAAGFATTDYYVNAKGKITQTAKESHYYGQAGTQIADKDHITLDVGQGKAQVHATSGGLNIQLGPASIIMDASGVININPVSAPTPIPVEIKYTETKPFEMQQDNAPAVLPAKGKRNPIPCAAPYNKPSDVLAQLDK